MRIRQRPRIRWSGGVVKPAASQPNERWSMDFVSDCVSTGKVIRMLTIVDDCTRECPAIEVDTSLGGLRVRRVLDRIAGPLLLYRSGNMFYSEAYRFPLPTIQSNWRKFVPYYPSPRTGKTLSREFTIGSTLI
jgi:transposase InsO family protein